MAEESVKHRENLEKALKEQQQKHMASIKA